MCVCVCVCPHDWAIWSRLLFRLHCTTSHRSRCWLQAFRRKSTSSRSCSEEFVSVRKSCISSRLDTTQHSRMQNEEIQKQVANLSISAEQRRSHPPAGQPGIASSAVGLKATAENKAASADADMVQFWAEAISKSIRSRGALPDGVEASYGDGTTISQSCWRRCRSTSRS